jgi:hypothetical protein
VLPDDVLLAIFNFFVVGDQDLPSSGDRPGVVLRNGASKRTVDWWQPLVHVCRRWRDLVFGSPRCLNLQLYCKLRTVMMKTLDVWPALPFIIEGYSSDTSVDNLISLLGHSNRQINLKSRPLTTSQIEKVWTAMQVPFPKLTALTLDSLLSQSETLTVVPDSFLSAPRLRVLTLLGIPFPGLKKLLLFANLTSSVFPIPGTFHPKRWSHASPC